MGHLLSTINPDAAARANGGEARPLPAIGSCVVYHPRPGEVRRGRDRLPALVTARDEANRLLEVVIVHDAADLVTQDRVPEYVEGDRGWSFVETPSMDHADAIKALRADMEAMKAMLLGDYEMPDGQSVLSMLDIQDERVSKVEDQAKAAVVVKEPVPSKRRLRGNRG